VQDSARDMRTECAHQKDSDDRDSRQVIMTVQAIMGTHEGYHAVLVPDNRHRTWASDGGPPLLMSTRASAVSPAKARQMCSSSLTILRTVRASCSFAVDFFSTPVSTGSQIGS